MHLLRVRSVVFVSNTLSRKTNVSKHGVATKKRKAFLFFVKLINFEGNFLAKRAWGKE